MPLPDTIAARTIRIRRNAATHDDMDWLRITRGELASPIPGEVIDRYVCDCRCRCHGEFNGASPGYCGLAIDLDTLDCYRACRSAHILASECSLDETRPKPRKLEELYDGAGEPRIRNRPTLDESGEFRV